MDRLILANQFGRRVDLHDQSLRALQQRVVQLASDSAALVGSLDEELLVSCFEVAYAKPISEGEQSQH